MPPLGTVLSATGRALDPAVDIATQSRTPPSMSVVTGGSMGLASPLHRLSTISVRVFGPLPYRSALAQWVRRLADGDVRSLRRPTDRVSE